MRWPARLEPGTFGEVVANIDLLPTLAEMAGGRVPDGETVDGQSFLPLLLGEEAPWREGLLLEVSNIKAIVTDRYKYIANRPPPEVVEAMAAEAEESAQTGVRRQISWDGTKNPHVGEEGIRYGSDRDFPHYFDADQLYDLESDPFEQVNLAGEEKHAAHLERLKELLEAEIETLPHTFGEFKTE
jgi:arylsulfatase A-like enzyme